MSGRGRSISRMKVASLNYRLPQDETSGKKNRRRFPEPAPREEDGLPGAVGVHFASRLGGGGREGRAAQQAVRVDIAAGLLHHRRPRSEEHTSELQSRQYLVCRLLLEKKK